ncbi:lactoylglutathione lyase [Jatrophihabitans endophyticus]|uniref:Lactoylglutathione lyase n=1 Tax=Jatrophihabitans endophyticus TaxID=1206085 RepID=A0A1M5C6S1_9ACTN|nr:VOC family protein [Jatrophihabitans endophyticus]SHF50453.1 lactoylglutathione lyase [Jatrophihabitans endophyticus]
MADAAPLRAFPVVYATAVRATVAFYERLGFTVFVAVPTPADPGYVGLRRDGSELAVVDASWSGEQFGAPVGDRPRFELFVYVTDVDATVSALPRGTTVLREPADMPWGERVAYVADPDGNPVALAAGASPPP